MTDDKVVSLGKVVSLAGGGEPIDPDLDRKAVIREMAEAAEWCKEAGADRVIVIAERTDGLMRIFWNEVRNGDLLWTLENGREYIRQRLFSPVRADADEDS